MEKYSCVEMIEERDERNSKWIILSLDKSVCVCVLEIKYMFMYM